MEITSNCDLVEVFHREPVMHDITHHFTGRFERQAHWTPMTPAKARELARALQLIANKLDALQVAAPGE
jgi:hypothetical protein